MDDISAFLSPQMFEDGHLVEPGSKGMTLRDYFAIHAPEPDHELIEMYMKSDRLRNPHNDSHKPRIRSKHEIAAMLRYEYADSMMAEREKSR